MSGVHETGTLARIFDNAQAAVIDELAADSWLELRELDDRLVEHPTDSVQLAIATLERESVIRMSYAAGRTEVSLNEDTPKGHYLARLAREDN